MLRHAIYPRLIHLKLQKIMANSDRLKVIITVKTIIAIVCPKIGHLRTISKVILDFF